MQPPLPHATVTDSTSYGCASVYMCVPLKMKIPDMCINCACVCKRDEVLYAATTILKEWSQKCVRTCEVRGKEDQENKKEEVEKESEETKYRKNSDWSDSQQREGQIPTGFIIKTFLDTFFLHPVALPERSAELFSLLSPRS